jgi:hypothetical protein
MTTIRARRRAEAERFYRRFCPGRTAEIDYIDFDHAVRDVRIPKGTILCGIKDPRVSPFETTFFCLPVGDASARARHSGSPRSDAQTLPEPLHRFQVLMDVPHALESVCPGGLDAWSLTGDGPPARVGGGGWQYKIPEPYRHLRFVPPAEAAARRALSLV